MGEVIPFADLSAMYYNRAMYHNIDALERYRRGEISLERAAMEARLPLYELIDLCQREGIQAPFTPEEIRLELQDLLALVDEEKREHLKELFPTR
jgi:hypothetical protein